MLLIFRCSTDSCTVIKGAFIAILVLVVVSVRRLCKPNVGAGQGWLQFVHSSCITTVPFTSWRKSVFWTEIGFIIWAADPPVTWSGGPPLLLCSFQTPVTPGLRSVQGCKVLHAGTLWEHRAMGFLMALGSSKAVTTKRWRWGGRRWRLLLIRNIPDRSEAGSSRASELAIWVLLRSWTFVVLILDGSWQIPRFVLCSTVVIQKLARLASMLSSLPVAHFVKHVLCRRSVCIGQSVVRGARTCGERPIGWIPLTLAP